MHLVVKRGAYFFVVRNPLIKQRKAVTKLLSNFFRNSHVFFKKPNADAGSGRCPQCMVYSVWDADTK